MFKMQYQPENRDFKFIGGSNGLTEIMIIVISGKEVWIHV